ncbi:Benzoylformate decarboxylase [Minicystis rosea]|nr:Benzoylformate decarboxylase [Minicystis rosea]
MSTVRERAFEVLRAHGVTTMFGNPGSTEIPLLADFPRDFRYVLGLQEAGVTAMAIGYALASDGAAAVNIHTFVGTGNAMGMIATAWHAQAPLVITAGEQDRRMLRSEPFLSGKHVEFARPYVKWSVEVTRSVDVPEVLERAYHLAMSEPRGPVFVSIPMDGLQDSCPPVVPREVSSRTAPDPSALARAAAVLDRGKRFAIVVGSQADAASATTDLVALAERLRAAVFLAPEIYRIGFPTNHPLYQGMLPPAAKPLADRLRPYDTVLVVGAPVFAYYPYVPGPPVHAGTQLVQLTNDPSMASRALVGSSVVGDVALAVRGLLDLVRVSPRHAPLRRSPKAGRASRRLDPDTVFGTLAKALPKNAILAAEAPSWQRHLLEHVRLRDPGSFYASASGSLGFALPAAVGIALAQPDRPVVSILGDGSAQYTIQGLWTAARYRVPVTFIVLDNEEYAILKSFERFQRLRGVPGLDLPGVDFEGIARGYGLSFSRVTGADDLGPILEAAFAGGVPSVVHVPIDPFIPKLLR